MNNYTQIAGAAEHAAPHSRRGSAPNAAPYSDSATSPDELASTQARAEAGSRADGLRTIQRQPDCETCGRGFYGCICGCPEPEQEHFVPALNRDPDWYRIEL